MTAKNPVQRLQTFKQILLVSSGVALALLATTIIDNIFHWLPSPDSMTGWHCVWFVVQVATIALGGLLLMTRELPLAARLNTAFGYFAVAWIALLAIALRMMEIAPIGSNLVLFGLAAVIGAIYWWLRRTYVGKPEEMFP